MNAIEIESLSKTYEKRGSKPLKAVVDLSLSIPAGQVFGFLGPNGAGKTTTIKMMCGLIIPTAGSVLLNGHDVQRDRGDAMRQIGRRDPERLLAADGLGESSIFLKAQGRPRQSVAPSCRAVTD